MPHYEGSNFIDTRDYPRDNGDVDVREYQRAGRQGIDSAKPRQVGETFNARLNLISKIGSSISLFFGGQRYGSARVVGEPCKDPRYQVEMQRQGGMNPSNMAEHVYTFQVEHSDYSDQGYSDAPDYDIKPRGEYVNPYT